MQVSVTLQAQDTLARKEIRREQTNFFRSGVHWTIEVPLWIPGFAGSFSYGDINVEGEDGVDPVHPTEPPSGGYIGKIISRLFEEDWYLKFVFLTKIAYEGDRFLAQFDALAGSVGESTKFLYNNNTLVQANFRTINFRLLGGYKFMQAHSKGQTFQYELFGYLGIRAHQQKIYSDLDGLINTLDINPVWVEPIVGLQNQFTWPRWFIILQADYGGYFVENKHSFQLTGNVYFKTGKTTSVKLGWNHLYMNHKGSILTQDYQAKVTLSGPSVGIAFQF
jgi:hypothetical protein